MLDSLSQIGYNLTELDKRGYAMATKEQIEYVFSNFMQSQPTEFLRLLNGAKAGVGYVLKILNETDHPITAGEISDKMNVSTARVAVLLRKMINKDFIVKESDKSDARVTIVKLTDYGRQMANAMRQEMQEHLSVIIDTMGMDKINEFILLSNEIKTIAETKLSLKGF